MAKNPAVWVPARRDVATIAASQLVVGGLSVERNNQHLSGLAFELGDLVVRLLEICEQNERGEATDAATD